MLQGNQAPRSPVFITMQSYARLLADAITDYRSIIRWLGGESSMSPPAPALTSVYSEIPTWTNLSVHWLLSSIPRLPLTLQPHAQVACPDYDDGQSTPIASACGNASSFALDGNTGTVLISRAANATFLHAENAALILPHGGISFLFDLQECAPVNGLQATVRLARPASVSDINAELAAALRPVMVRLYALSDPTALGWREATIQPLSVSYTSANQAESDASFSVTFPAYAARYWVATVYAGEPSIVDNSTAFGDVLRVPDLAVRVTRPSDATGSCQGDELIPFDDSQPSVPKVRNVIHPTCILFSPLRPRGFFCLNTKRLIYFFSIGTSAYPFDTRDK